MPREVSIHELRYRTDAVIAAVRAGERLTVTVDGEPVADIVPRAERRNPSSCGVGSRVRATRSRELVAQGPGGCGRGIVGIAVRRSTATPSGGQPVNAGG
jgi:prevent-host-death family protein